MIPLLLGVVALLALMGALGMFSRARIATIKVFAAWVLGLGGLILAVLLFLTGRLALGIAALTFVAPTVWEWMRPGTAPPWRRTAGGQSAGSQSAGQRPPPRGAAGRMSREEAYDVLGLPRGADRAAVQAAYVRLMQAARPDRGGSDWLAARINQARDALTG